jgi:MFS family permease
MTLSSGSSVDQVRSPLSRFGQFSILLVAFVWIFEASAVAPILGQLATDFPGTSTLKLQLVSSAVFFTSIFASVVAGALARRFDRKRLVVIGLLVYGITGMLPALATNIDQIILLRLLTGVGVGLVLPMPNIIISERYSGNARERLLGLATAVANVANVINSVIVGFILLLGWRYAFLSFAIVLVIMVVQIIGLPSSPPPRHVSAGPRLRPNVLALPARVWGLALLMVANWAIFQSNILNMAFFMQSEHLGAPWTLGIAIALPALGSIITGGFFARLHNLLGRYISAAGLVVFCLGFVLLANVHSLGGLMLANIVIGLGGGVLVPLILFWTTQAVDEEHHEVALGVVSGCIHVGFIVAPFAQAALAATIGNPDVRVLFFVEAVVLAVAAVVVAVLTIASGSTRRVPVGE